MRIIQIVTGRTPLGGHVQTVRQKLRPGPSSDVMHPLRVRGERATLSVPRQAPKGGYDDLEPVGEQYVNGIAPEWWNCQATARVAPLSEPDLTRSTPVGRHNVRPITRSYPQGVWRPSRRPRPTDSE
jgi:hypothetical protein